MNPFRWRLFVLTAAVPVTTAFAQFSEVPTTNDRLRREAEAAPLAMQFTGSTPAELQAWQTTFGDKLRSLLGPHRPPTKWEVRVEERREFADFVRERLVVAADGHPALPLGSTPAKGFAFAPAGKRLAADFYGRTVQV